MPKQRENSKMYLKVSCKKCNKEWYKLKSDVKRWISGMCTDCNSLSSLKKVNVLKVEEHPLYVAPILCEDCSKPIKVRGKRLLVQKKCADCYQKSRNKSFCKDCSVKLLHSQSIYCAKCFHKTRQGEKSERWVGGLAKCKLCEGDLSIHKNSSQYNTGICRKCYRGELCHRWDATITMEERENSKDRNKNPLSREWRRQVFGRDNFTCQKCGQYGGQICSHHIENYSKNKELRFDVDNGITFCTSCHIKFHKKYGWFESNREQLNYFLEKQKTA